MFLRDGPSPNFYPPKFLDRYSHEAVAVGGAYFVSSFARTSDGSVNEHDGQVWHSDPTSTIITGPWTHHLTPQPPARSSLAACSPGVGCRQ
jgi:hypothetical protein